MPITPSMLAKRVKPLTFDYLGDPVNVEYYPSGLGLDTVGTLKAWVAKANATSADEEAQLAVLEDFGTWICTIVAKWDYCEDDGVTMQPLTPKNIARQISRFPDFILAVLIAIFNDRTEGNASGTPPSPSSDDTSSPMESSDSTMESLSPSDTSSLPDGSVEAEPASNGSSPILTGVTG